LSPRAAVDINVRRSLLEPTLSGGGEYRLNPWVLSIGLAIRH
jgi:hypothetical protein